MILDNRVKYSFGISVMLHLLILWFFGYISVKEKHEIKFITNIDIVEPVIPGAPPGPKEEKPKNIWEFMKMAIPTIKKPDLPGPKDDKPLDVVKKEVDKALEVEKKLVDKEMTINRKADPLKFKELNKEKELKFADISKSIDPKKLDRLIEQEKKLADREEPVARKSADALKFDEVGLKRADKIKDVMSTADAGKKVDEGKIRDLTPSDLLSEKKAPLDKSTKVDDLGIKLTSKTKDDGKIKEIIGTAEERKKVREYLALEEKLIEKAPARVASGGGGGGGGGKPAIGYGGGGGINLSKNEDLKKVETKVNIAPAKKTEAAVAAGKTEASKSSVELIGPLQGRGIIASYMPKYPEWMKEKGIEADVAIRFFVAPNGSVKDDMSVERTSGYAELDKLVMAVLKSWQFEPLAKSAKQEDQWGVVTVRFRLAK